MINRIFTPASARAALRLVRPDAMRARRLYREMESRSPERIAPDELVERAYFRLVRHLHGVMARIVARGATIKDLEQGLIDFPARRAGREVWLCWKVGELSLDYWHEKDAGFAGRRPIDEDGPWEDAREAVESPGQ